MAAGAAAVPAGLAAPPVQLTPPASAAELAAKVLATPAPAPFPAPPLAPWVPTAARPATSHLASTIESIAQAVASTAMTGPPPPVDTSAAESVDLYIELAAPAGPDIVLPLGEPALSPAAARGARVDVRPALAGRPARGAPTARFGRLGPLAIGGAVGLATALVIGLSVQWRRAAAPQPDTEAPRPPSFTEGANDRRGPSAAAVPAGREPGPRLAAPLPDRPSPAALPRARGAASGAMADRPDKVDKVDAAAEAALEAAERALGAAPPLAPTRASPPAAGRRATPAAAVPETAPSGRAPDPRVRRDPVRPVGPGQT